MKNLFLFSLCLALFISCGDDDGSGTATSAINPYFENLTPLGSDYVYEAWMIVDGAPVAIGRFNVDDKSVPTKSQFLAPKKDIENATAFVVTIEPGDEEGSDLETPSTTKILAGSFDGDTANLTATNDNALVQGFGSLSGQYLLATPTDGDNAADELSGIWFLDNSGANLEPSLTLPGLSDGWRYEGWVVMEDANGNAVPVSTGKFSDPAKADSGNPYSETVAMAPPFPGEDFLTMAPDDLTFPTDLSGMTAVISIEPNPDDSASPYGVKPLIGEIPTDAAAHTLYSMESNLGSLPTGRAVR